ncbi:MAG TPA: hypothetical protein VH115_08185, partial [Solirubrobacteraceae bacterium]|nr:hypothetical protein [Solirubrobacteraceae bacterium]
MGLTEDDRTRRTAPRGPRSGVFRAALWGIAGGGLTAAGLAGLASGTAGAETAGTLQTATEEGTATTPAPAPPPKKGWVPQEATEEAASGSAGSSH